MKGAKEYFWEHYSDEDLLKLRLCDLKLSIEKSRLAEPVNRLHEELAEKNIKFRPHFWISNDWFTPDGVPGIAIPFYMVHPRLARLEKRQVFEAEGWDLPWCLRLLRHECGHAIENAYKLRRRKSRRDVFGKSTQPYTPYYAPRPYSRKYVHHLDTWYAQSHPDEDFAETFAVWLTPRSNWRKRYEGWSALRKLEYMDELMRDIAGRRPLVAARHRIDALPDLRMTLREHYRKKKIYLGLDHPEYFSRDLRKLFSDEKASAATALSFLRKVRKEARRIVARWTGVYQYTIDQVIEDMMNELRGQGLRLSRSMEQTKKEFISLLTVQTMNYIHDENHKIPR